MPRRSLPPTACGIGARYNQQKSAGLEADLPSSLRCLAPFRSETALPEANSFRRSRPTVPQHSRGFEEHCSADWWRCDVSERSGPGCHLSRARFDRANAGQYPHTVARKSAIRLRSEHQARRLRRVLSETQAYRGVVWASVTQRHGEPGRTRCQMQQGESRGKGQADLPAE